MVVSPVATNNRGYHVVSAPPSGWRSGDTLKLTLPMSPSMELAKTINNGGDGRVPAATSATDATTTDMRQDARTPTCKTMKNGTDIAGGQLTASTPSAIKVDGPAQCCAACDALAAKFPRPLRKVALRLWRLPTASPT